MLLKAELPLVFSAFHMSGFTPSQVIDEISRYRQLLLWNKSTKSKKFRVEVGTTTFFFFFSVQHLCGACETA